MENTILINDAGKPILTYYTYENIPYIIDNGKELFCTNFMAQGKKNSYNIIERLKTLNGIRDILTNFRPYAVMFRSRCSMQDVYDKTIFSVVKEVRYNGTYNIIIKDYIRFYNNETKEEVYKNDMILEGTFPPLICHKLIEELLCEYEYTNNDERKNDIIHMLESSIYFQENITPNTLVMIGTKIPSLVDPTKEILLNKYYNKENR